MASTGASERNAWDDLMDLEKGFYDEGFEAGREDGKTAGLIEGKLFGMEKGYEKALELGRLRGRAMVWSSRFSKPVQIENGTGANEQEKNSLNEVVASLPRFESNDRLKKHVETLLQMTNPDSLNTTNSDEAVAAFDDLLIKARNKAKIASSITGDATVVPGVEGTNASIEDARGLSARH